MNREKLNFEINLVPMIDVLSACICFLLMTVVWTSLGSFSVQQSVGAVSESENLPVVTARMQSDGSLKINYKTESARPDPSADYSLKNTEGRINWAGLDKLVRELRIKSPVLRTAVVLPHNFAKYQDVISVMDIFRKNGISDVGISPL